MAYQQEPFNSPEQFRVSGSGFSRVGGTTVKSHTDLMDKIAPKSGYVYIYISNERRSPLTSPQSLPELSQCA